MRAVVLDEPGPSSHLMLRADVPVPGYPLGPAEVRVRVAACAVAYRDLIDRTGGFRFMKRPVILGHEFSGVVEEAGVDVPCNLQQGQRVASLHWAQVITRCEHRMHAWPNTFCSQFQ